MNEVIFERLYDKYYRDAKATALADVDASLYAYETASNDMHSMSRAELKNYMREIGA